MAIGNYQQMMDNAMMAYTNIIGGYDTAATELRGAQRQIDAGYRSLYGDVLGSIAGAGNAQSQAIRDSYAANAGRANQDLISRGLGNTTVASAVGRGLQHDAVKAQNALAEQVSQQKAAYMSQLGQSRLSYLDEAARQNTALRMQQLGARGSYADRLLGIGAQGVMQGRGPGGFGGPGGAAGRAGLQGTIIPSRRGGRGMTGFYGGSGGRYYGGGFSGAGGGRALDPYVPVPAEGGGWEAAMAGMQAQNAGNRGAAIQAAGLVGLGAGLAGGYGGTGGGSAVAAAGGGGGGGGAAPASSSYAAYDDEVPDWAY